MTTSVWPGTATISGQTTSGQDGSLNTYGRLSLSLKARYQHLKPCAAATVHTAPTSQPTAPSQLISSQSAGSDHTGCAARHIMAVWDRITVTSGHQVNQGIGMHACHHLINHQPCHLADFIQGVIAQQAIFIN